MSIEQHQRIEFMIYVMENAFEIFVFGSKREKIDWKKYTIECDSLAKWEVHYWKGALPLISWIPAVERLDGKRSEVTRVSTIQWMILIFHHNKI